MRTRLGVRRIAVGFTAILVFASPWTVTASGGGARTGADHRSGLGVVLPTPGIFDDFNRNVSGAWGVASSGQGNWVDNSLRENGRSSAEAGNSISVIAAGTGRGVLDLGTQEPVWMLADRGNWISPSWTMTAKVFVDQVPSSSTSSLDIGFWLFKDTPAPYADAGHLELKIGSDVTGPIQSGIQLSGTIQTPRSFLPKIDWSASTWYVVRWSYTWGGISMAKVWRYQDPEPDEFQLVRDPVTGAGTGVTPPSSADYYQTSNDAVFQIEALAASGQPANVEIDDLRFDSVGVPTCSAGDPGLGTPQLPAAVGVVGDQIRVRYDPAYIVDPSLPHAWQAATEVAKAMQSVAGAAVNRYRDEFHLAVEPHIDIDLLCHPEFAGQDQGAPAFTPDKDHIEFRNSAIYDSFNGSVQNWVKNPATTFVPPPDG